jgi:hypothetical protein
MREMDEIKTQQKEKPLRKFLSFTPRIIRSIGLILDILKLILSTYIIKMCIFGSLLMIVVGSKN